MCAFFYWLASNAFYLWNTGLEPCLYNSPRNLSLKLNWNYFNPPRGTKGTPSLFLLFANCYFFSFSQTIFLCISISKQVLCTMFAVEILFFRLCTNSQKDNFDQRMVGKAPVGRTKNTTITFLWCHSCRYTFQGQHKVLTTPSQTYQKLPLKLAEPHKLFAGFETCCKQVLLLWNTLR